MGYLDRLRKVEDMVGTILYQIDSHCLEQHGGNTFVRIPLTSSDCNVIQFEVPSKDVIYRKCRNASEAVYDIVIYLTQLQYGCVFSDMSGNQTETVLHRDVLTHLYNSLYPGRCRHDHIARGVPQNAVGPNDIEYGVDYRQMPVTIYSALIEPDIYITFWVNESDIMWQKDWQTKGLCSYVNIMLSKPFYIISYRNKSTNWHEGSRQVSRDAIIADVQFANRAVASGMIRKDYGKWLSDALKMEFLDK